MIEELRDFLIRHGWDEDVADDLHDAIYEAKTEQEEKDNVDIFMKDIEEGIDRALVDIKAWKEEVGEL